MTSRTRMLLILVMAALVAQVIAYTMFHIPRQLEMVIIVVTVLAYPVIRFPLFGVYAAFILGVFTNYFRRLYYLVYERPGIDPLLMGTDAILVLAFLGLYFEFRNRRGREGGSPFFTRLITGYLIYLTARVFVHNILPPAAALAGFKNYGPAVLAFFIGQFYSERRKDLRPLWSCTIVLAVAASLYGLKQLYVGYSEAEKIWITNVPFVSLFVGQLVRPFSFFQAPVLYADYLQLGLVGSLIVFGKDLRRGWPLLILLLGLFGWATLTTSVRSSWIGLALTLPLWFGFVNVRGAGKRLAAISVSAAIFALVQLTGPPEDAPERTNIQPSQVSEAGSGESYFDVLVASRSDAIASPFKEHSFQSRLRLWRYLVGLANEPFLALLGRGVGALKADSLYITYLAELGYPGMLLIIFIIVAFVARGLAVIDRSSDENAVAIAKGVTVMNLIFAVISVSGTHLHTFPGDLFFWFWNGVIVSVPLPAGNPRGAVQGDTGTAGSEMEAAAA